MRNLLIALGVMCVLVAGAFGIAGLTFLGSYGSLNAGNQDVHGKFANIESELQRRSDLVPNLVTVVKGYAKHEHDTFTDVTEARAKVGQVKLGADVVKDPSAMANLANAQGELSSALSRLMVVSEQYPELKASDQFRDLQSQLEGTENRINVARKRYNESVQSYNTAVNGLLRRVIANMFGFTEAAYYKAEDKAQTAPIVKFD